MEMSSQDVSDHSLLARWFASPSAAHLAAHGVKRLVLMQSLSIPVGSAGAPFCRASPRVQGHAGHPWPGGVGHGPPSTSQHARESPPVESRAFPVGDGSLCPQLVETRVGSQPPSGVCVAAGVLYKSQFPATISPGLKAIPGGARPCPPRSRQDRGLHCYLPPTPGSQRFLDHCPLLPEC